MTSQLTRDSVLRRPGTIMLTVHSAGEVTARVDEREVELGVHALGILAACSEPRTFGEIVDRVSAQGARDFAALIATILRMIETGVLLTADSPPRARDLTRWQSPEVHIGLLDDDARTSAFLAALEELTRPDDVVLDIGSGTGVLAVGAARAGARQVYAIEASGMAARVEALASANDVSDRLAVIQAWSTRAELPERASLLVTETVGNDPLGEHIVDIVLDAKRRLLTPDARIVPSRIQLFAVLVEIPAQVLDRIVFGTRNTARWSERYGIAFSSLCEQATPGYLVDLPQVEASAMIELSEPQLLGVVDLYNPSAIPSREATLVANRSGLCAGVMTYFDLQLSPKVSLSTRPSRAAPSNHWHTSVWLDCLPRELSTGDKLDVAIKSRAANTRVEILR